MVKIVTINLLVLAVLLLCGEFFIRMGGLPEIMYPIDAAMIPDEKMGWVMKVGRQTLNRQNSCGEEVIRTPSKSPYIVKFPAAASERAPHTVLFVGDSFTNGTGVSTGLAYYDVVEELAEGRLRIFASGIRNYGTSQERMLIEAIFDQVRPDLIVWQLTENDAIDNRFILDDEIPTNNRRPRPYLDLESGRYAVRNPGFWLFDVSVLIRWMFLKFVAIDHKYELGIFNELSFRLQPPTKVLDREIRLGIEVMTREVSRAREQFGTPILTFSANAVRESVYAAALGNIDVHHIADFPENAGLVEGKTDCLPADIHWNRKGHRTAGEHLYGVIERYFAGAS